MLRWFSYTRATHVLLMVLVFSETPACMRPPAPAKEICRRASVLLLTIDSLRPDHLSTYGYWRDTSPELTALARDGVVFRNAFAAASWTSPALVSLFTAEFPAVHGVIARGRSASASLPTPLKALRAAGYRVPDLFYFQEIADYRNLGFEASAGPRTDAAAVLRWIEETRSEPFFLAYHLRKVHLPYNPPPPHDRYFVEALEQSGQSSPSAGIAAVRSKLRVLKHSVEFDDRDRPLVVALYDGAVQAQDEELGVILQGLRALGRYDDLLIVVTADHGEELLEHGFVGHPSTSLDGTLYDEVLRVPLIIKFPGQRFAGRTIDTLVRSVDVLPTVLDAVGLGSKGSFAGRSLLAVIHRGRGPAPGPVFAETSVCGYACPEGVPAAYLRAVRDERYKLIEMITAEGSTYQLFDLLPDSAEQHNVADNNPRRVEQMRSLLRPYRITTD